MGEILPSEVVEKLPTPEEAFKIPKLTWRNKITTLWGSAVIALGMSIGSGEFLLGPSIAIKVGLGLVWLVWIGAILQTIYIYSFTRIAIVTGETPVTTFMRISIWAGALGAIAYVLSCIWAGWAASSATALVGGFLGKMPGPADRPLVTTVGIALLLLCFVILSLGRRIARTLELFNWFDLGVLFPSFIILAIILVPLNVWGELAKYLVSVGYIPPGVDLTVLGGWWGYIGSATGLNYALVYYFKDKGFGMGSLTGYISALVGGKKIEVSPFGKTFKLTPENLSTYKRWLRLALEELFIIFCLGAIVGMVIPMTLAYGIAYGWKMEYTWNAPLWLSQALNRLWGAPGYWWGVLVAVLVLFKTQLGVVDNMVRLVADALWKVGRVRSALKNDIRILYYIFLAIILAWATVAIYTTAPVWLIVIQANMANFAALFGVPFLLYINSKMPKELRMHWTEIIANIIFMIICGVIFIFSVCNALGIKLL